MSHPLFTQKGGVHIWNQRYLLGGGVLILILGGLALLTSFFIDTSKIQKGTWIWDTETIVAQKEDILNFAAVQDISTIYLYIDDQHVTPKGYQDFIRSAHEKGIEIEALGGEPEWALTTNQNQINKFISWVKQYNAEAQPEERFQGVHFDIEPYLTDQWKSNRDQLLADWMKNMRFIADVTKGSGLKLTADVPYWIHKTKVPDSNISFSAWILETFDCLVLMDYRNFALGEDGIVENARAVMRQADELKKQAIVAVDTTKSTENERTTFHSLSLNEMESELKLAKKPLSRYASFSGFAVHDYRHWVAISKSEGE